ncbi:MAG: hypothetical protein IPK18_03540 [Sphingobacteriales bacterium]|nr:MAG: hypothetical protein IPK18_03540 [Sphingobacteriales bacterium]
MAAKTALYILGGLLLIPGLYQFYNISQLESLNTGFMGAIVDSVIEQKKQFGYMLTIGGSILIAIGYFIKPKNTEEK